jgi:hypothetical protein
MPAPAPETVALARNDYVEGVKVSVILQNRNLTHAELYESLDGKFDDGSGKTPAPIPRRRHVVRRVRRSKKGSRESLAARLWRTAERQVHDIEARLIAAGRAPAERERDTRMLAILVKTLNELARFDGGRPDEQEEMDEDDRVPGNLDDLRRELSRRLDAMAAGGATGIPDAGGRQGT